MTDHADQIPPASSLPALPPAAKAPQRIRPYAAADAVLTAALEAVASLEGDDLEVVLRAAEAHRFAELSRRAFAAADRLAAHRASAE